LQRTKLRSPVSSTSIRFIWRLPALYEFIWNQFTADWYLELSNRFIWIENARPSVQRGTRRNAVVRVLGSGVGAWGGIPFMPFITRDCSDICAHAGNRAQRIMPATWRGQ